MISRMLIFLLLSIPLLCQSQDYGDFPNIAKEDLLNDLEILYQSFDKFHTGMYWYTPKDSVDVAFQDVRDQITTDINVLKFHKLIAPLVALSREDHTNIFLPKSASKQLNEEIKFLPFTFIFLGKELHCVRNGSAFEDVALEGKQIESINGETPVEIVDKIGHLFASDGFIKTVKYSDLRNFDFSKYYYYYYGQVEDYEIQFSDMEEPVLVKAQKIETFNQNLRTRYPVTNTNSEKKVLEYEILNDSVAYLGIHDFNNGVIKENSSEKKLSVFLENSFKSIEENNIQTLIIDVSKNTGGTEGNAGLLYSYVGDNYQKYKKVKVKTQKAFLDNGSDKPIKLKAFGFFERVFTNKKMKDGTLERKQTPWVGLKAYKKEPDYKFSGETYVLISPITYSGASEYSNMMYSQGLATFVGQETGGGYLGNTSGYLKDVELPHSKIVIEVPTIQFVMNVEPKLPFGRGVIPHHEVIPTFEQYINGENASLNFVLEQLENGKN